MSRRYNYTEHIHSVDKEQDVLETDILLPDHLMKIKGTEASGGMRQLMVALLSDGVESYILNIESCNSCKCDTSDCEHKDWVERKDIDYIFSFENVCQSLGIDADYLREGIASYIHEFTLDGKEVKWQRVRRPRKVSQSS